MEKYILNGIWDHKIRVLKMKYSLRVGRLSLIC